MAELHTMTYECPCGEKGTLRFNKDVQRSVTCTSCDYGMKMTYKGGSSQAGNFIKRTEVENTGGGCMVDIVVLDNDMVVTISDECLVVHPNMQSWHDQRPEQNCTVFSDIQEAEDKRVQEAQAEVLRGLGGVLENWCDQQCILGMNALEYTPKEMLKEFELTVEQRHWLNNYITMWELSE